MSFLAGLSGILTNLGGAISGVTSAFENFASWVTDSFKALLGGLEDVWDAISGAFSDIGDFFSNPFGGGSNGFEEMADMATLHTEKINDAMSIAGDNLEDLGNLGQQVDFEDIGAEDFDKLADLVEDTGTAWEETQAQFESGIELSEAHTFYNAHGDGIIEVGAGWEVTKTDLEGNILPDNMIGFKNAATGEFQLIEEGWVSHKQVIEDAFDFSGHIEAFTDLDGNIVTVGASMGVMNEKTKVMLGYSQDAVVAYDAEAKSLTALNGQYIEATGIIEELEREIGTEGMEAFFAALNDEIDGSRTNYASIFGIDKDDVSKYGGGKEGELMGLATKYAKYGKMGLKQGLRSSVPWMSEGGIVSGPASGFPAVLHGTEAVVPLSGGRSIPVEMKGSGGGNTFNITVNAGGITDRTDKRQLARDIGNQIQQEVARSMGISTTRGGF